LGESRKDDKLGLLAMAGCRKRKGLKLWKVWLPSEVIFIKCGKL
jgi:hypothetical protein